MNRAESKRTDISRNYKSKGGGGDRCTLNTEAGLKTVRIRHLGTKA
jgi:hypothetical protein